ncbi:MAG TPA: hypothetical protein VNM22_04320 [Candidatus Limnocylindrales bacterium]|nr:hypothetical protein [Candidatus Limnocylindrales bacterium]
MSNKKIRSFDCGVVHEVVQIYLTEKRSLGLESQRSYFIQCNQEDCQYVEENKLPCPLNLAMFAEELNERRQKMKQRKENAQDH